MVQICVESDLWLAGIVLHMTADDDPKMCVWVNEGSAVGEDTALYEVALSPSA